VKVSLYDNPANFSCHIRRDSCSNSVLQTLDVDLQEIDATMSFDDLCKHAI
jgi:hypothetical protein